MTKIPLRALLDGKDFYYSALTEAHRKNNFACPHCESRVIHVLPKLDGRIKHFRHRDKKCQYAYEHETQEHLSGKKVLMEIASKLGLKAITEYRISKHITDVFIDGKQPLAVEFQCSKCPSAEVVNQTKTYVEHNVAVFWILRKNFYKDFSKENSDKNRAGNKENTSASILCC